MSMHVGGITDPIQVTQIIAKKLNDPNSVSFAIVEAVRQGTLEPRYLQTILHEPPEFLEFILAKEKKQWVDSLFRNEVVDSPVHTPSSPAFKVVDIPGKGKGVIAIRDLKEGDLLLVEKPIVTLDWENEYGKDASMDDIARKLEEGNVDNIVRNLEGQIAQLSQQQRDEFYSLHIATPRSRMPRTLAIFLSNSIGVMPERNAGGIFLLGSRFNHSCQHSLQWTLDKDVGAMKFRLIRDVGSGEEITGRYMDTLESSRDRELMLEGNYGFKCRCEVCSLPSEQLAQSDEKRRYLSNTLAYLKGSPSLDDIPLRYHSLCLLGTVICKDDDIRGEFENDIAYAGFMLSVIFGYEKTARIWLDHLPRSQKRTFGPNSNILKKLEIWKMDLASHPAWRLMDRFTTKQVGKSTVAPLCL